MLSRKRELSNTEAENEAYDVADCRGTRYPCKRICPCGRQSIGEDIVSSEERTLAAKLTPETNMRWMKGKQWN
jgi:hypothetical protein